MVRFAKDKDLPFLKEAWKVCFDDPQDFIDWNFENNFSYEDTLIAEVDGTPASNLQLMPHRIRLRDTDYAVNYVSGVATLPKFRNRGLVRELFAFAFEEMKKLAGKLSQGFPQVRVDLYDINGKIYFGELTFFDSSGGARFDPREWDEILGSWIELPEKTKEK